MEEINYKDMSFDDLLGKKNLVIDSELQYSSLDNKFIAFFSFDDDYCGLHAPYIGVFDNHIDYFNWCKYSLYPFMNATLDEDDDGIEFNYNFDDDFEDTMNSIYEDLSSCNFEFEHNIIYCGDASKVLAECLAYLLNKFNDTFI